MYTVKVYDGIKLVYHKRTKKKEIVINIPREKPTKDFTLSPNIPIEILNIVNLVTRHLNTDNRIFATKSRKREFVKPRQMAHFLLWLSFNYKVPVSKIERELIFRTTGKEIVYYSVTDIGLWTNKDHSTVIYSYKAVMDDMYYKETRDDIILLANLLDCTDKLNELIKEFNL